MIKFKYNLPETSFFFMNFPDWVTLSPGMASSVDVSFRPIKSEYYDDTIEFITTAGNFYIHVVATLPEFGVKMQKYLDFGFSTVKEESVKTFTLRNVGEVDAPFELLSDSPFHVSPTTGVIKPGDKKTIQLHFLPTEASVFVGTVVCKQPQPRPALVMKISGIGKIPHIVASKHVIDYEAVLTSQHRTEEVILSNTALVPVSFEIRPHPHDHDTVFHWQTTKGRIPADGSVAINIKYSPLSTGSFDLDYFDVVTPGGNVQTVCCKGFSEPHRVEVYVPPPKTNPTLVATTPSLNYGQMELGNVALKTVNLINKTKATAFFQFITEANGVFEFSRTDGTIIPESTVNVDIKFHARVPGNYYRRIFVLVKNQGPLYLDLTATAYHQVALGHGVGCIGSVASLLGPHSHQARHMQGREIDVTCKSFCMGLWVGVHKHTHTHTHSLTFCVSVYSCRTRCRARCRYTRSTWRSIGSGCKTRASRMRPPFTRRRTRATRTPSIGTSSFSTTPMTGARCFSRTPAVCARASTHTHTHTLSLSHAHAHARTHQVFLEDADIEFGALPEVGVGEYKAVTVVNNTDVKYTAQFIVPPDKYVEQPEGAGGIEMTTLGPVLRPMETCWKIFPGDKLDVLPRSRTQFKVAFRPEYRNAYYAQV